MIRNVVKCLALAGAVLLGSVIPAHANKWDGWVCGVTYTPASGTLGTRGYIFLNVNSAPDCSGTFVHNDYFCTTSATNAFCALNYLQSEAQILALHQSLLTALDHNIRIQAVTDNTCVNPDFCGTQVSFMSSP